MQSAEQSGRCILSQFELDERRAALERQIAELQSRIEQERREAAAAVDSLKAQLAEVRKVIVVTEDLAMLQEAGVYHYRHPLSDAVAYQKELEDIESQIKEMTKRDGGAVLAITNWTVYRPARYFTEHIGALGSKVHQPTFARFETAKALNALV